MADRAKDKSSGGRFSRRSSREEAPAQIPIAPLAPESAPPPAAIAAPADSSLGSKAAPGAVPRDSSAALGPAAIGANPDRAQSLERELAQLRAQSAQALATAEEQLSAAARRIEQVDEIRRQSMPPPPTELNALRAQLARVQVDLTELRADRDEQKRRLESTQADLDSARAQAGALAAALLARDARVGLLESGVHASDERARSEQAHAEEAESKRRALAEALEQAEKSAAQLRGERERLQRELTAAGAELAAAKSAADASAQNLAAAKAELESSKAELQAQARDLQAAKDELAQAKAALRSTAELGSGLRGDLDAREAQMHALRREAEELRAAQAALRGEVELERAQARAREAQIVGEVRDREARMIAEVQSREAKLIELAQAREQQLLAEAEAALQALTREKQAVVERSVILQKALEQAREREATLDAEARLKSNAMADDPGERELQLEDQLDSARRDARIARDALEETREARQRAETRVGELQATVDSLGLERAALRAEAGQVRAQLEMTAAVERRAHQLVQELEELRGENEFLNAEVARYAMAEGKKPPTPPRKPKE